MKFLISDVGIFVFVDKLMLLPGFMCLIKLTALDQIKHYGLTCKCII